MDFASPKRASDLGHSPQSVSRQILRCRLSRCRFRVKHLAFREAACVVIYTLIVENCVAEPTSIFDVVDEAAEASAIAEAEADIAAGRVVPHDDVIRWIKSWFTANELPSPKPR